MKQLFTKNPESNLTKTRSIGRYLVETYLMKNIDSILFYLFELISLAYSSNYELRRHIIDINAKYQFSFGDRDAQVSIEIRNGGMRIFHRAIENPNICLKFRDSKAIIDLFFSKKPDILGAILKQEVVIDGNLSYIYKFVYLINHLQTKLIGF